MLIGQGPLKEEIEDKVKNLGLTESVKFLGQRNDVSELYQAFDVFVLPSLYEGLPVVGVEAQATGLLCVLSDDMTKETKVLNTTKFISIDKSTKEWVDCIIKGYIVFKRTNTLEEIRNNNFDIKKETKKLEEFYIDLIR